MQYLNNDEPLVKKRNLLFVGVGLVAVVTISILLFVSSHGKKTKKPLETYYDPGSGETISNPLGKVPETTGQASQNTAVYLGFDKLLNVGITNYQLEAIKQAFSNYFFEKNQGVKYISATVATIVRTAPNRDTNDERDIVTFSGTFDQTTKFNARVESSDSQTSRLYLYDKNDKLLFDSGDVNTSLPD